MRLKDYTKRVGHEAVWLIGYALGVDSACVYTREEFLPEEAAKIERVILRRESGEPLQYIMGVGSFYGRDFRVGSGVLIPRRDTQTLIEAVKKIFVGSEAFTFTDWGTGSGCIAITLLLEFPNSYAYLVEASTDARYYAAMNLQRYSLTGRAEFVDALPTCTLTVANPPYIPSGKIAGLQKCVKDYEPRMALDGGDDGMDFYRQIFAQASSEYIILEAGSDEQIYPLQTMSKKYECFDNVRDDGRFQRCLMFRMARGD